MDIMGHLSSTMYYEYTKPLVDVLNTIFGILGQSKPLLTDSECQQLLDSLPKLDDVWKNMTKCIYFADFTTPPKFHYVKEGIHFAVLWEMPLGWCCEESIESHHRLCNVERCKYLNQRGSLRVKFMMDKLTLITDPKFSDDFSYAVDREPE